MKFQDSNAFRKLKNGWGQQVGSPLQVDLSHTTVMQKHTISRGF